MLFNQKFIYEVVYRDIDTDIGFLSYGDGCYDTPPKDERTEEETEREKLFGWLDDERV